MRPSELYRPDTVGGWEPGGDDEVLPRTEPEKCLQQIRTWVVATVEDALYASGNMQLVTGRLEVTVNVKGNRDWLAAVVANPAWLEEEPMKHFEITRATELLAVSPQLVAGYLDRYLESQVEVLGNFAVESSRFDSGSGVLTVMVRQLELPRSSQAQ